MLHAFGSFSSARSVALPLCWLAGAVPWPVPLIIQVSKPPSGNYGYNLFVNLVVGRLGGLFQLSALIGREFKEREGEAKCGRPGQGQGRTSAFLLTFFSLFKREQKSGRARNTIPAGCRGEQITNGRMRGLFLGLQGLKLISID